MIKKDWLIFGMFALLIAALGYLLYKNYNLEKNLSDLMTSAVSAPTKVWTSPINVGPDLSDIIIGGHFSGPRFVGAVRAISGNSITLLEDGGALIEARVSGATKIIEEGELKGDRQFQRELDEYNARIKELMKDPQGNREKLAALRIPSDAAMIPISLSEIQVGDTVVIAVGEESKDAESPVFAIWIKRLTLKEAEDKR